MHTAHPHAHLPTNGQFDAAACHGYLDTATVGIPPNLALTSMESHLADWRAGRIDASVCDTNVARSRAAFAEIVGVRPGDVAVGSQLSPFTGLVATSLRPRDVVLVADGEFTSVLFPFLAQEARGVRVRSVPGDRLVEAIDRKTALVAVSSVQSSDGAAIDLEALADAADHYNTDVFLDATQSAGALPLDATRFAYVAVSAYKWLLCPRGTAFFAVRPDALGRLVPHFANWYASEDPWSSIYGLPLRIACGARRFDLSPAWPCWAGAAPALEALLEYGIAAISAHDLTLADRLRAGLGLAPTASPIVRIAAEGVGERLEAAGVRASTRAGGTRLSLHLYNDARDVDRVLEALDDLEIRA